MKQLLIRLFSMALFLLCTTSSYASCTGDVNCSDSALEKIYILPEQLGFTSQGIFVNVDNQWLQAETLFSDEHGIYFHGFTPSENGCRKNYYPCRNCDRCVKDIYDTCPLCGRPT